MRDWRAALRTEQDLLATAYVHAVCPPPRSTCLLTIWHLKGQKSIEEEEEEEEITFSNN